MFDKDAFTRPHQRRRRSEKSSQGQWARNKFNGAAYRAPRLDAYTGLQWESELIRTHTGITEKRDPYLCVYVEKGQAGRQAGRHDVWGFSRGSPGRFRSRFKWVSKR